MRLFFGVGMKMSRLPVLGRYLRSTKELWDSPRPRQERWRTCITSGGNLPGINENLDMNYEKEGCFACSNTQKSSAPARQQKEKKRQVFLSDRTENRYLDRTRTHANHIQTKTLRKRTKSNETKPRKPTSRFARTSPPAVAFES